MKSDPYKIDQSTFAQVIHDIQRDPLADDLPDEPPHPLRENPHVATLCNHLEQMGKQLFELRKPDGEMSDDSYFRFNEGLELRPEVLAMIIIDYIKQHPEIISE